MRHDTLRETSSDRSSPPVFPGQAAVVISTSVAYGPVPRSEPWWASTVQLRPSPSSPQDEVNLLLLFDQTDTPEHCRTVPCRESRQPRNRHSLSSRPKSVLARMLAQTA